MKQLSIGNESIAFQNGGYFKELTTIFAELLAAGVKSAQEAAPFFTRIDRCNYDNIGIATLAGSYASAVENAFVAVPMLTKGSVLNSNNFNKWLDKNFNAAAQPFLNGAKTGTVDPSTSRVSGAFSEIVFKVYATDAMLFGKKYTAEELAAAMIHEVGHAFTFLQFLADQVMCCHVLQRSYQELTSKNVDVPIRITLEKTANDLDIKNKTWLESLDTVTDKEVAFRILASAVQIEPREIDNKRFFSLDACEELADIFAARHGAAKAIVSLRLKSPKAFIGGFQLRTSIMYGALGMVFLPLLPVLGVLFAMAGTLLAYCTIYLAANTPDITTFKQAAAKMRNQVVEQLKQTKLPKEEINPILDNLDAIDEMIQSERETKAAVPVLVRFIDMFRRGKMDARSSREYTDRLEVLAANDLFARAAQFRAK